MERDTQEVRSAYQTLTAVSPRLLSRPADARAVSLLGQAVSDVLDHDKSDTVVRQMVADLESARSSALAERIDREWALPLAAVLGLLRQHLHNRTVAVASANPSSATLRDKVLAAVQAGVQTPTAIGLKVKSPINVVSRVLAKLTDGGLIEWSPCPSDRRVRRYHVVDQPAVAASMPDDAAPPAPRVAEPVFLVRIADDQTRINVRHAAAFLPDLVGIGCDSRLDSQLRVQSLGVAGVIVRSNGGRDAAQDALDLSETAEAIARQSDDDLLIARARYERARAVLFADPKDFRVILDLLDQAAVHAGRASGSEALIRLGWCAYSRGLVFDNLDTNEALQHVAAAVEYFRKAGFEYGTAAALTLLTRIEYVRDPERARETAGEALSLANRNGYLRIMAESAFWAGELASDRQRAHTLFSTAAEHFEAIGNKSWQALCYASLKLSEIECQTTGLDQESAKKLVASMTDVQSWFDSQHSPDDDISMSRSWAAAVFRRRVGTWLRLAGDFDRSIDELSASIEIYQATADTVGENFALAGLIAAQRGHRIVDEQDARDAQDAEAYQVPAVAEAYRLVDESPLTEATLAY